MLDETIVRRAVRAALEEDLGAGDITSHAVIDEGVRGRGSIVARESLILAGLPVAREVFREIDRELDFREVGSDGEKRKPGDRIAIIEGSARSILAGERTALNFLQRMSGIATTARRLVRLASSAVEIADTRKTAPGLRSLDKYAVRAGGGTNHRSGLFDAVLIKDNHWRLAGGVGEAVRRARGSPGIGPTALITIEVSTLEEIEEALAAGANALLLDNMDRATLARAVEAARGRAFLEVSGGVREESIPDLATLGVNRISIGALTHSVQAVDIALELEAL